MANISRMVEALRARLQEAELDMGDVYVDALSAIKDVEKKAKKPFQDVLDVVADLEGDVFSAADVKQITTDVKVVDAALRKLAATVSALQKKNS